jgi:hypothetical protein
MPRGIWNFENVLWNWAQYSQRGLTFDLGDFVGNPNGRARIDVGGTPTVFATSQYRLLHSKWGYGQHNHLSYPTQSVFTAQAGNVSARVTMYVQKTDPLSTGPPPSLVIYEQTSHFTGDGFKEYTATTSATP